MENWVVYTTLRRVGGSLSLTLPIAFVRANGFRPGQRVKLEFEGPNLKLSSVESTEPKVEPE